MLPPRISLTTSLKKTKWEGRERGSGMLTEARGTAYLPSHLSGKEKQRRGLCMCYAQSVSLLTSTSAPSRHTGQAAITLNFPYASWERCCWEESKHTPECGVKGASTFRAWGAGVLTCGVNPEISCLRCCFPPKG